MRKTPEQAPIIPGDDEYQEKPAEIENPDIGGITFRFSPDEREGVLRRLVQDRLARENLPAEEKERLINEEEKRVRIRMARKSVADKDGLRVVEDETE